MTSFSSLLFSTFSFFFLLDRKIKICTSLVDTQFFYHLDIIYKCDRVYKLNMFAAIYDIVTNNHRGNELDKQYAFVQILL